MMLKTILSSLLQTIINSYIWVAST